MKYAWLIFLSVFAVFELTHAENAASLTGTSPRLKNHQFPLSETGIHIELAGPIATTSWKLRYLSNDPPA